MTTANVSQKPTATFMMGGPASGKTRARNAYILPGELVLDCDEIKKELPGYDPKNPGAVHAESNTILNRRFYAAIGEGASFVYDGTGTNAEKYVRLFNEARAAGYEIVLIYVPCTLALAIKRNAERERVVPTAILIEKYENIEAAFEILAPRADVLRVVNANN